MSKKVDELIEKIEELQKEFEVLRVMVKEL